MKITASRLQNINPAPALLELPMRLARIPRSVALAVFLTFSFASPVLMAGEDPLENVNRATHQFNRAIDTVIIKPLARTYEAVLPRFAKAGVRNFFNNLDDVKVIANDVLQLNLGAAVSDLTRVAINSTVGVGGLLDVAEPALGLAKNRQDFGMTLAHYGVQPGPYLVLPLLGPSTVRDALGLAANTTFEPLAEVDHVRTRNALAATQAVDFRARVLNFDNLIIGDDYLFIKQAYLQQREYSISGDFTTVAFEDF